MLFVTAASYTASTSYQTVDNSNSYISNTIPDSSAETQGFNYQFSNQYYNQYNNQYRYNYQQPSTYFRQETSTFRPIISIINTASKLFKSKPQVRIGTVYL